MRKHVAAVALAIELVAAAPMMTSRGELQVTMTPAMEAGAQRGVRKALRDPDSARFGTLLVAFFDKKHGWLDICGQVNARNGYGGYAGTQYFHAAMIDLNSGEKGKHPLWYAMGVRFDKGRQIRFFRTYPVCYMPGWK